MSVTPLGWNVVVVAKWNPAILTPNGIAQYVLGLSEGTVTKVELSVDRPGVFRVLHEGFVITADESRLTIEAAEPTYRSLLEAAGHATRAIEQLPRTPLTAIGLNIRYKDEDVEQRTLTRMLGDIDHSMMGTNLDVTSRLNRRTVRHPPGVLNIETRDPMDGSLLVEFNFHCSAARRTDALEWLRQTEEGLRRPVDEFLSVVLGVTIQEAPNA